MAIAEHSTASTFAAQPPIVVRPRMTEEQFVEWCTPRSHAEWVDGEVIVMSPVSNKHNKLDIWLLAIVQFFIERFELGEVRGPEMQVRFGELHSRRQPDLLFVSKAHLDRIRPNHVEGSPELIVEIVSPESQSRDWRVKYLEYEAAGVAEYLVIDPITHVVELYRLNSGGTYEQVLEVDGRLSFTTLPAFFLKTEWLWSEPLPKLETALKELGVL